MRIKKTLNGLPIVTEKIIYLLKDKNEEDVIRETSNVLKDENPLLFKEIVNYSKECKDYKNVYLAGSTTYYFLHKQAIKNFNLTQTMKKLPMVTQDTIDGFFIEKEPEKTISKYFNLLKKENHLLYIRLIKYLNSSKEQQMVGACPSIVYGLLNRQALFDKIQHI